MTAGEDGTRTESSGGERLQLPMLDRTTELAALHEALTAARRGERVVATVEGRPGAGKTRLMVEVAAGHPDVSVITAYAGPSERDTAVVLEEDQRLIMIDDAQWASPALIGRLQNLVADERPEGLAIIIAHLPPTGAERPPYRGLVDAARRWGRHVELPLGPLTAADVRALLDAPDAERYAGTIAESTEGWPRAIEQLVHDWIDAGAARWSETKLEIVGEPPPWHGPPSPEQILGDLDTLPRRLVEATAIARQPLPVPIAATYLEVSEDETLDIGERLTAAGLLAESVEGFLPRHNEDAERIEGAMGATRRGRIAQRLADAYAAMGADEQEPSLVGFLYLRGGAWDKALPLLTEAAQRASDRQDAAGALRPADGALEALEEIEGDQPELEGRLRLWRALAYRLNGWSDLADADLEIAVTNLAGSARVDALALAAQIKDDLQQARLGEPLLAAAEIDAAQHGDRARLGVLLTERAKVLARMGLAAEADATFRRGIRFARWSGEPFDVFRARRNGAWIAFDRGQVHDAEQRFTACRADVEGFGGEGWLADVAAWQTRAQFASGQIEEARATYRTALRASDRIGSIVGTFLANMGLAEGTELLGRFEDSLVAAEDALAAALEFLPAWENATRYLRAKALAGLGRTEEALAETHRALAACPPGIDGLRWRLRCRALLYQLGADEDGAQLTRELLDGRWLLPAAELMVARAEREGDPELARQALALALELGVPMLAARAAQVGGLWDEPLGTAAAVAVREMIPHVPDDWHDAWSSRPEVATALALPEPTTEQRQAATDEAHTALARALEPAALVAEDLQLDVLDWVEPPPEPIPLPVRRRRNLTAAFSAVASVGALTVAIMAITGVFSPTPTTAPPVVQTTTIPTTTTTLPWQNQIEPVDRLAGQWRPGGTTAMINASDSRGAPNLTGFFWKRSTPDAVESSAAIEGVSIFVGTNDGELLWLDAGAGAERASYQTRGKIRSAPVLADVREVTSVAGGGSTPFVFVASDDGILHAIERGQATLQARWTESVGPTDTSPVFWAASADLEAVFVGTDEGLVHAFKALDGTPLWLSEDGTAAPYDAGAGVSATPALVDGLLYVGTAQGVLHAVDAVTGSVVWTAPSSGLAINGVSVADGVVYITSADTNVWGYQTANGATVSSYAAGAVIPTGMAIADGMAYFGVANDLYAVDVSSSSWVLTWSIATGARVESTPAVAGGIVYVGNEDGDLLAVNAADGVELWRYPSFGSVKSTPAVIDGMVVFGSSDGVYAVGCVPDGTGSDACRWSE